jgi:hypothetical protein
MPTLLVDFDGVIHRYSKGWHDGTAYDEPDPAAREALQELEHRGYEVIIFSTRSAHQIHVWLARWGFPPYAVTDRKIPATALIDDRAIHHTDWYATLDELAQRYPTSRHGVIGSPRTTGIQEGEAPHAHS